MLLFKKLKIGTICGLGLGSRPQSRATHPANPENGPKRGPKSTTAVVDLGPKSTTATPPHGHKFHQPKKLPKTCVSENWGLWIWCGFVWISVDFGLVGCPPRQIHNPKTLRFTWFQPPVNESLGLWIWCGFLWISIYGFGPKNVIRPLIFSIRAQNIHKPPGFGPKKSTPRRFWAPKNPSTLVFDLKNHPPPVFGPT